MEDPKEEEIDGKYIIKEKKGSGGTANAFLVTEKGNNTEYIAKVLKKDNEDTRTYYNNEVKYLTIFKNDNNPNVIKLLITEKVQVLEGIEMWPTFDQEVYCS